MKHFREGGTAYVKKLSTLKKLMNKEGKIGNFTILSIMQGMAGQKVRITKLDNSSAYCKPGKGASFYFPFAALTLYHKNKKD